MPPSPSSSPSSSPRTPSSRPRPASTATTARGPTRPRPGGSPGSRPATDGWHGSARSTDLTPDEAIDRDLVVGELEAARFAETELREDAWNPLEWVYLLGEGIFTLIAREFAPLADRLDVGREPARGHPARPGRRRARRWSASRAGRWAGSRPRRRCASCPASPSSSTTRSPRPTAPPSDPAVAALTPRLREAAAIAKAALGAFEAHLRDVVLPASDGEGRLGRDLFARKMRHTMRSDELTAGPDPRRGRARVPAGPCRDGPAGPRPVAGVVRRPAAPRRRRRDRPRRAGPGRRRAPQGGRPARLLPRGDRPDRGLLHASATSSAWPTSRSVIQWTPVFLRAFGGAMLSSPGPLDKGQKAFFAITPMPDDWSEEQRESYLREDNERMLRLLSIHEAVPGHYLQGVYANRVAVARPEHLRERPVRRGLGRLRDPGDDGRRLRRGRPGAAADPLEVLPALDHQRDHRRADPQRRHDRGRGGRADGRRRVPGGVRGARQVSTAPGCHRRSCRPTSRARWRCGRSSSTRAPAPAATRRSGRRRAAAASARRRASSTATTSSGDRPRDAPDVAAPADPARTEPSTRGHRASVGSAVDGRRLPPPDPLRLTASARLGQACGERRAKRVDR